jgi:hypothetical protein
MRVVQRSVRVMPGMSARTSFELLFSTAGGFAERFHAARGDVDVAVLDWLIGPNQRLLSYTMCERDADGNVKDRTKCLETQVFEANDVSWQVESHLKPDGAVGNLFLVDTKYKLFGDTVVIEARCTCLKRIWGFSSMVESVVEQQTAASLDLWCQLALEAFLTPSATASTSVAAATSSDSVVEESDESAASSSSAVVVAPTAVSTSGVPARKQRSRLQYNRNRRPRTADLVSQQRSMLPHKQLSTMKRVAQGHDSILRLLASGDVSMMNSPSDEDVRRATAALDYDDDDVERGGMKEHSDHRSRSRRRTFIYCVALMTLLLMALAAVLMLMSTPAEFTSAAAAVAVAETVAKSAATRMEEATATW